MPVPLPTTPVSRPGYSNVDVVPQHSHQRTDAKPLKPRSITELTFDLLPISWRLPAGHSLRLAISCADRTNFEQIVSNPFELRVFRQEGYVSRISVPMRE